MAKKPSSTNGNDKSDGDGAGEAAKAGAAEAPQAGAKPGPTLNVLAQYVKDLSFENPNAPQSLATTGTNPNIQININVNARGLSESNYEVELTLEAKAAAKEKVVFNIELTYAGIFRVENVPAESLQPIMLIECPRILFPFARQIVASASRDGGFPPLMVDPIDFAALYRQRVAQQKGQAKA
ncbi:MAG: protein-export chaperone SecB [Hyphomicrobiales bacterium]|nr:protein-export chaperone SecB [Hyphomicrobiales bacterium]